MELRMPAVTRTIFAAVVAVAGACGDDPPPAVPAVDSGPRPDTGPPVDAGLSDAGPDAGLAVLPTTCELTSQHRVGTIADGHLVDIAVGGSASSFLVAWTDTRADPSVLVRRLSAAGELDDERVLASGARTAGPAALATDAGWLVAWARSDAPGPWTMDLEALALDGSGAPGPGGPSVVAADGLRNHLPALAASSDGVTVAWVSHDPGAGTLPVAMARTLSASGEPTAAAVRLSGAGQSATRIGLGSARTGVVSTWLDASAGATRLLARTFDATLEPSGPETVLSTEALGGAVSLSASRVGATVVFDVVTSEARYDTHVRHLSDIGETIGPERRVTLGAPAGRTPSMVRFPIVVSGGLCGSVLLTTSWAEDLGAYRISLVDPDDVAIYTIDVPADASAWPRSAMALADDGTAAVVWTDAGGAEVHAATVQCR
jgi:hypothetical protein